MRHFFAVLLLIAGASLGREKPAALPTDVTTVRAVGDGIEIQFAQSLDTQSAADADHWSVFAHATGSSALPEKLAIERIAIGTDDRTVFLQIVRQPPGTRLKICYAIRFADGKEAAGEVEFPIRE
jgi:hypothetical protein